MKNYFFVLTCAFDWTNNLREKAELNKKTSKLKAATPNPLQPLTHKDYLSGNCFLSQQLSHGSFGNGNNNSVQNESGLTSLYISMLHIINSV
jgi:hypothetical protein